MLRVVEVLSNTASATGSSPGNTNDVSDVSDDGDDSDGNTVNDRTDNNNYSIPILEVTKTFSMNNGMVKQSSGNDIITYTITVQNKW